MLMFFKFNFSIKVYLFIVVPGIEPTNSSVLGDLTLINIPSIFLNFNFRQRSINFLRLILFFTVLQLELEFYIGLPQHLKLPRLKGSSVIVSCQLNLMKKMAVLFPGSTKLISFHLFLLVFLPHFN